MHTTHDRKSNSSSAPSGGIGVAGLLGVAFVVLKLCHVIDWSWWYVTLPFWGPLAVVLAVLAVAFAVVLLCDGVEAIAKARRRRRDRAKAPEPLHGPVRKWGYRPADVDRLRERARVARADRASAPGLRGDQARLRRDRDRVWGDAGEDCSVGIWPAAADSNPVDSSPPADRGDCGGPTGGGDPGGGDGGGTCGGGDGG